MCMINVRFFCIVLKEGINKYLEMLKLTKQKLIPIKLNKLRFLTF